MSLEIIALVAMAVVVAGGALLSVRISRQRNKTSTNKVTIRDVETLGDVAGRDINKKQLCHLPPAGRSR
jgi:hypothetical protein